MKLILPNWLKGIVFGLGFILCQFSISLYLPALPKLGLVFAVDQHIMLMSVTYLLIGYGLGQLVWGTLSDRYGRQRMLMLALFAYISFAVLITLSVRLLLFNVFLTLASFCIAAMTGIGNAMLRDMYGKEGVKKVIARIGVVMAVGPIIAPVIGSHLLYWFDWHAIFLFLIILAIVLMIGISLLGETKQHQDKLMIQVNQFVVIYKEKLKQHEFLGFLFSLGIIFGCMISYISTAPFIFTHFYAISLRTYSWLFSIASCSYIASTLTFCKLADKVPPARFVLIGNVLALLGSIGLSIVAYDNIHYVSVLMLATAVMMCGFGLVISTAKAGAMTIFKYHNGSTASLMKASQVFLCVIVTSIAANLYNIHSFFELTAFYISLTAISLILFIILNTRNSIVARCHGT